MLFKNDGGENSFRKNSTSFNEGLKSIERGTLMKLKPFEIDFIIDYYTNAVEWLMCRLDHIKIVGDSDNYDDDLRDKQICRIRTQMDEIGERIKELEEFKKNL